MQSVTLDVNWTRIGVPHWTLLRLEFQCCPAVYLDSQFPFDHLFRLRIMSMSSWPTSKTAIHDAYSHLLKRMTSCCAKIIDGGKWILKNHYLPPFFRLIRTSINCGFHLEDLHVDGRPMLTCLPFPVPHFDVEVPEYNHEGLRCCVFK